MHYSQNIMSLGSCFADRMGERLADNKFPGICKSFGDYLQSGLSCPPTDCVLGQGSLDLPRKDEIFGHWYSYDLHSQWNKYDLETFQTDTQASIHATEEGLRKTNVLIITFGTAWVYQLKESGQIVANCHRSPASLFRRNLLSIPAITDEWFKVLRLLQGQVPELKIILTVSPVRHIKDGLSFNGLSKATLRLACHQLSEAFPDISYFPSYEIMMDDLRDYRFYQDDLIHPTKFAEQYIWEGFVKTYFSPSTRDALQKWEKIQKDLAHKPFQPQSPSYRVFLTQLLEKMKEVSDQLDCEKEIQEVQLRDTKDDAMN